jgi:phosphoglycerol geranylgeranyltransferase
MAGIYRTISDGIRKGKKFFAWLIDPDKYDLKSLPSLLQNAEKSGVDLILLGGSLLVKNDIAGHIDCIKQHSNLPVVLFPGSTFQLSNKADGILLLSLISGRNPDYLIGRQVEVAALLKKSGLEVLPTGYMIIDTGTPTTASYISNSTPIPYHKIDIAINTAIAAELLGLKMIFLEGGSGSVKPIDVEMVKGVRQNTSVPIIVGGGIRNAATMKAMFDAGADVVVIGNAIESNPDLLMEFAKLAGSYH